MIQYVTQIHLEYDSLRLLPAEATRLGMVNPLIVTDRGIVATGLLDRLLGALPEACSYQIYDRTPSNPTEAQVDEATELYKTRKCDGFIGLGGGSPIDLAKAVAIMASHDRPLAEYALVAGGRDRIQAFTPPIIAVPTTAGTGSEVSGGAMIILDDGRKLAFGSAHLVPKSAICDPALTLGLPPMLTAATGMDAIAHCIETFLAPGFNPMADAIALDGLERAWKYVKRATADGSDKEARLHMMCASTQGALAFQKGLGAVHALSHPLGGLKVDGKAGLHHGTLNAIVLPAVLRFNASAASVITENKYARMRRVMGLQEHADVAAALHDMSSQLGLPTRLSEVGIVSSMLDAVAEAALVDVCHASNPRAASRDDYLSMLEVAL